MVEEEEEEMEAGGETRLYTSTDQNGGRCYEDKTLGWRGWRGERGWGGGGGRERDVSVKAVPLAVHSEVRGQCQSGSLVVGSEVRGQRQSGSLVVGSEVRGQCQSCSSRGRQRGQGSV